VSSSNRPDRRRATRTTAKTPPRKTQSRKAPPRKTQARRPAPRKAAATRSPRSAPGGSMLNTLIIVLLVVLALMTIALVVVLNHFVF
jgi:hypothetical protein